MNQKEREEVAAMISEATADCPHCRARQADRAAYAKRARYVTMPELPDVERVAAYEALGYADRGAVFEALTWQQAVAFVRPFGSALQTALFS